MGCRHNSTAQHKQTEAYTCIISVIRAFSKYTCTTVTLLHYSTPTPDNIACPVDTSSTESRDNIYTTADSIRRSTERQLSAPVTSNQLWDETAIRQKINNYTYEEQSTPLSISYTDLRQHINQCSQWTANCRTTTVVFPHRTVNNMLFKQEDAGA